MKKSILLFSLFLLGIIGYSQNTYPTAVNTTAGLGTGSATLPTSTTLRLKVTSGVAGNSGVQLTNVTSGTATVAGNSKALSVDASGNIILTPVVNTTPTSTNIYNSDGILTAARTVSLNGKDLTFNPSTASSQFFINGTNGNVGIGNISPTAKLDVLGVLKANQGIFTNSLADGQTFASYLDRNDKCAVLAVGKSIGSGTGYINTRMINFFDFPVSNLDAKSSFLFSIEDRNNFGRYRITGETGGTTNLIMLDKTQAEVFKVYDDGNNKTVLSLAKSDSYLGIGTTNFVDGLDTYRLSVKGAIRADRVRVYTTWADYVFEKNYQLPTLEEVEKHIQDKGHLIDIPSAKEVEEKGVELGEMNKLLLQKVEELTLYMIEMKKEINTLKAELNK
jgi:hypothetical protein